MTKQKKDEIKKFLNRAYKLTRLRNILEREYKQKQKEVDSIAVSNSEIRSMKIMSNVENKAIELISLKKDIDTYNLEIEKVKNEIISIIDRLEDENHKKIIQLRYLKFRKWEEIAEILNYSEQHIHRLHNKALKEVDKILKNVSVC